MAFDNRQRVASSGGVHGPSALLAAVAVVVLGVALVLGGAFGGNDGLRLGTAVGSTTLPTPTTATLPDTSAPEALAMAGSDVEGGVTTTVAPATSAATVATPTTGAAPTPGVTPTAAPSPVTTPPRVTSAPTPAKPAAPAPTSPPTTAPPTAAAPSVGNRVTSVEAELLRLTNRDRASTGVGALTRNTCMDSAAAQWARHMAETGEMAHSSESGRLVQDCRGSDAYWGDNVGWWDPCLAGDMEDWWMNSPSHRSNIVSSDFDTVGIAVVPGVRGYCWFQVLFAS